MGEVHIKEANLEGSLLDKVTEEAGQAPDDIDCPGDLAGEVGTTMRCVLTAGIDELDVDVEVTSVEGKKINFNYEIGQVKNDSSAGTPGSGA